MLRVDWRTALRGLAGFAVALAIWAFASPLYDRAVAACAEQVMRAFERPPVTRLNPYEEYISVDRSDFDPRSQHPAVPVKDLTFNFLLLAALFAMEKRPLSDRNVPRFFLACALLAVTHVFALVAEVMSIYVMKLGLWSTVHYGDVARNVWSVISTSYRVVLMYAIAFALWWICRPSATMAEAAEKPRKRKRR